MIIGLGLSVVSWVIWRREPVDNLIFGTESGYLFAGELRPVIKNDGMWEAEAT